MRIKHPEWRDFHEPTNYPFADESTLVNDAGDTLFKDLFLDAAFYPVGGEAGGRLSKIEIFSATGVIWYGDEGEDFRASATFSLGDPPDSLRFLDTLGRPAGLLVSESQRLAVFQSWGVGSREFSLSQTGLAAAVCMPAPEPGVRGVIADDGQVLTDDVYIVGDDGVLVTYETITLEATCERPETEARVIRIDVVGDPLWRRKECAPGFFSTPRFLETITFQKGGKSFVCGPGGLGNIRLVVGNDQADDTILRIRPTETGIKFEAVGERLEDIK